MLYSCTRTETEGVKGLIRLRRVGSSYSQQDNELMEIPSDVMIFYCC